MKIFCRERIYAFRTMIRSVDWSKVKRFINPGEGYLPWRRVVKIAFKNLWKNMSRTTVTVGGIAVGVGAIVLLVSFGYGLQEVVTERIIWPEALRVSEASSESSRVRLDQDLLTKIGQMKGVVKVAPSARIAGKVVLGNSRIDTVVVAGRLDYFDLSNVNLVEGEWPEEAFDFVYQGPIEDWQIEEASGSGQGAGEMVVVPVTGDEIGEIYFKLADDRYVPVYEEAEETGEIIGWAKGSVLERHKGKLVWGGVYRDKSGEGRVEVDGAGTMGKWVESEFELYDRAEDGIYLVAKNESDGQRQETGFVTMEEVRLMDASQVAIEQLLEEGSVLGETSASASLAAMLVESQETDVEEGESEKRVPIRSEGLKRVMVSEALVKAWNRKNKEVLGLKVKVEYLLNSSLLSGSGVAGRLVSEEEEYEIAGVFEEMKKPMIYVPLAEIESMGLVNYSSTKILVEKEEQLTEVRALVSSLGLVTKSVVDTLSQINKLFAVVRFLLGSFGAIALVVALFGMFNTMTVSLLERTREIGVMKSLGTSNLDVVRIFLAEAGGLSLAGGLVGIVLGGVLGQLIDWLIFNFSNKDQSMFLLPIGFVVAVLMLVVAVGLLTGLYPSRRASKISALNALRYE